MDFPVLYSFRRCPYAMRARLALLAAGHEVELREILLRDKPSSMITASPKATVPVLVLPDGSVLEESRDIMLWALAQNDPDGLLIEANASSALIDQNDGSFKSALDRYKYPNRHTDTDPLAAREAGLHWLTALDEDLRSNQFLLGPQRRLADLALAPFVRQFAHVDRKWFFDQPLPGLHRWLNDFLESPAFATIMQKFPVWAEGTPGLPFPEAA